MSHVNVAIASLALAAITVSSAALAVEPQPPSVGPSDPLWQSAWPDFSRYEAAATLAAAGATLALALEKQDTSPRWVGGVWFDDAVRDAVRLSSPRARQTAREIGNWPYWTAAALPLLSDPLVALLVGDDPRAAGNVALIGLEAFSYAGVLSFVSTRISLRERPDSTTCRTQGTEPCELDTEAFWSGHTSIVAASAGLVCANHRFMKLWGGGLADAGACILASTGALITSATRLAADRHYATDVLVGLGVGFALGYGVPVLFHYRYQSPVTLSVLPKDEGGAGIEVMGRF